MKKLFKTTFIAASLLTLAACGRVETGQVGVRTSFSGNVESNEVQQGFYVAITSSVHVFSVKQIPIVLTDLKPKAGDNLRLQDFDVTVYYTVNPNAVADVYVKYSNSTVKDPESGVYLPAYALISTLAKSAANDVVAKVPSMQLNDKRIELETALKQSLQEELDSSDKGVFSIDRVTITNILTDPSVEDSIRAVAASENKKKEAQNNLEVARIQAEENKIRSQSLDGKILAEKQLKVLEDLAKSNNRVFVIPQDFNGMLNIN